MIHIIKHIKNETFVKNVISDGSKVTIKFTSKKSNARKFVLYRAAANVIKAYLGSAYTIETIQEVL